MRLSEPGRGRLLTLAARVFPNAEQHRLDVHWTLAANTVIQMIGLYGTGSPDPHAPTGPPPSYVAALRDLLTAGLDGALRE